MEHREIDIQLDLYLVNSMELWSTTYLDLKMIFYSAILQGNSWAEIDGRRR
jgi:hypothetical protein